MRDYTDWMVWGGAGTIIAVVLAGAVWFSIQDCKHWNAFSEAHHCRLVGVKGGSSMPVITSKGGVAFAFVDGQNAFLCDDGVTYWRDQ